MISHPTRSGLEVAGLDPEAVERLVAAAISEDLADGVDVTTAATVPLTQRATLDLVTRQAGTVAGLLVAAAVFDVVAARAGRRVEVEAHCRDGDRVEAGQRLLSVSGATHDLLIAERTALNLVGHMSGVATATRVWADVLEGTATRVRDTRKTMPFLRSLEKYAVRCGGGVNHRMSLSDAALIKDNHVMAAGGVAEAFAAVRREYPDLPVEVEVDSLAQLREAIDVGADLVLLDNFELDQMREAVQVAGGKVKLEASGGLRAEDARTIAATGVDFVAVGSLTHSAPWLDIGGDLRG